jgi:hypothetical protein
MVFFTAALAAQADLSYASTRLMQYLHICAIQRLGAISWRSRSAL